MMRSGQRLPFVAMLITTVLGSLLMSSPASAAEEHAASWSAVDAVGYDAPQAETNCPGVNQLGGSPAVSKASLTTRVVAAGAGVALYDTGIQYAQTGTITPTNTLISFATGTAASSIGETLEIRRALNNTPAPGSAVTATPSPTSNTPNRLAIGPAFRDNPWPAGNNGAAMPAPEGMRIQMAMSSGQRSPGGFGTLDQIPDVEFVRNNLDVRPNWKADVSLEQEYEVPPGLRVQVGPVGPQTLNRVTYPGGANQVEILNYSDRSRLVPIGDPRTIK